MSGYNWKKKWNIEKENIRECSEGPNYKKILGKKHFICSSQSKQKIESWIGKYSANGHQKISLEWEHGFYYGSANTDDERVSRNKRQGINRGGLLVEIFVRGDSDRYLLMWRLTYYFNDDYELGFCTYDWYR